MKYRPHLFMLAVVIGRRHNERSNRSSLQLIMKRILFAAVVLAAVWIGVLWTRHPGEPAMVPAAPPPVAEKHYVTPRQLAATGAMSSRAVAPFAAVDQDGRAVEWAGLSGGRPLVLVFIKRDCPCNVELEPFFHRVAQTYRDCVRFAGVIDAPVEGAARYAEANGVPYPMLADAERRLISRFEAENGAYVALITPDGVLDTLWPGCSAEMMRELGRRIAACAGVAERPLDCTGMPGALLTGCPFSS
jgi:peroxiredoxin